MTAGSPNGPHHDKDFSSCRLLGNFFFFSLFTASGGSRSCFGAALSGGCFRSTLIRYPSINPYILFIKLVPFSSFQ